MISTYARMVFFFTALCVFLTNCSEDFASSLNSSETPRFGMTIGRGYDPYSKEQLRGDCLLQDKVREKLHESWVDANGIKAVLNEARVKTYVDLLNETEISANVAVNFTFGGGNASYHSFKKFVSSTDTFTWVMGLKVLTKEETLKSLSRDDLTPQARALVDNGEFAGFKKLCGTSFIRSIKKGGRYLRVEEVSSRETQLIKLLDTAVSGDGGGLTWSTSLSASFHSALKEAFERDSLTRTVVQEGGGNLKYSFTPDTAEAEINAFISEVRNGDAVPVEVEVVDWDTVVTEFKNPLEELQREEALNGYFDLYQKNRIKLDRVSSFFSVVENHSLEIEPSVLQGLEKKSGELFKQQDTLLKRGRACYESVESCDLQDLHEIPVTVPKVDVPETPDASKNQQIWERIVMFEPGSPGTGGKDGIVVRVVCDRLDDKKKACHSFSYDLIGQERVLRFDTPLMYGKKFQPTPNPDFSFDKNIWPIDEAIILAGYWYSAPPEAFVLVQDFE